jgi:23S rRNA (adenine2503-C2)-methyltransferase
MAKALDTTLVGKSREEIAEIVGDLGERGFRARQLYDAVYRRRTLDASAMTELPRAFRERLAAEHPVTATRVRSVFASSDGTRRYLLELGDGEAVESVFIPEPRRDTICISSQVGCAVGCTFCMTARMNVRRQMTTGEIVSQVLVVLNDVYGPGKPAPHGTNVVYMGMGEPMLNYREVLASVRALADPEGVGIAPRRMTVSTSGIVPRIYDLAKEPVRPELAISLSAPTDELRDVLIPINRKYPIADLLRACREFPLGPRERLTFEYVMLDGVNDSLECAARLARLVSGLRAKVNLIPHNPAPELPYAASPPERVSAFQHALRERGIHAFVRRPRGRDISAACGQLAARPTASAVA